MARGKLQSQGILGLWRAFCALSLIGGGLSALAYLAYQSVYLERVEDPIFVGLLMANTLTACRFGTYLRPQIGILIYTFNRIEYHDKTQIDERDALHRIFNAPVSAVFAVAFSALIACAAFIISPWDTFAETEHSGTLNGLLIAMLFFANLIIGYSISCVFRFWGLCSEHIAAVRLKILNASRPDLIQFQWMTKMIVSVSAVISCLAVSSLVFSVFDFGPLTIFFSIASFALVACTYFVPITPLSILFRKKKLEELNEIELLLSEHFAVVEEMGEDGSRAVANLLTYRDEVRSVRTLPPGGDFSLLTVASVSLVTFLPIVFEHLFTSLTQAF